MREKKIAKMIQKALNDYNHLYNKDELIYMKKELRNLKEQMNQNKIQTSKGFGN